MRHNGENNLEGEGQRLAHHGSRSRTGDVFAVILAGGLGTRFWPLSRSRLPKQFLRLGGNASLLRRTAERLHPLVGWERLLVVTHRKYTARVRAELPELPRSHVLAEPVPRSTLPALLLASTWIRQRCPDAVTIVAPADHVVRPLAVFRQTLRYAVRLAYESGFLVTLGVKPSRPETGYGYIKAGVPVDFGGSHRAKAFYVHQFREKPDRRAAARFLRTGRFFWNSGMFVWRLDRFWEAARTCAPELTAQFEAVADAPRKSWNRQVASLYASLPTLSVDHGILEPLAERSKRRVIVVLAPFEWSDIGSWVEVGTLLPTDAHNNAVRGRVVAIGSRRNIVWNPQRLVALVGINDLIVVDTPDAILVCAREQAQALREVTRYLNEHKWQRYL